MSRLRISDDLALPLDWMSMATVVYGARGAGKTTFGSVVAEEVTKQGQRFCAIDLKGDWYGLKSTADGKGEGIPVVVFGGEHKDVPLEEGAGAYIGRLVTSLQQSVIIDLEEFSKGKQTRFLAAFFEALYDANREPLLLLADEAQRYTPQRPIDPDASRCLGAVEDTVKLGRKHGLGVVLFTQRGSGLNKEVSEICDMLVAFRTPGPLDQDRVKDWLEANVTREQRDQVMASLSSLPTGTAVFASGHPDLKVFKTVGIRRRETFDSSATPKVGHRRVEPKRLAKPDLVAIQQQMADAIERAKQEDPKELRKQISELRRQLASKMQSSSVAREPVVKTIEKRVDVPVLKDGQLARLEKALERGEGIAKAIQEGLASLAGAVRPVFAPRPAAPIATPLPATPRPSIPQLNSIGRMMRETRPPSPDGVDVSRPQQKILDGLAWLETVGISTAPWNVVAWISDQSPKSSGYEKNISTLRTAGLIEGSRDAIRLTDHGHAVAQPPDRPANDDELRRMIYAKISTPQQRMLEAILSAGRPLSWDELA